MMMNYFRIFLLVNNLRRSEWICIRHTALALISTVLSVEAAMLLGEAQCMLNLFIFDIQSSTNDEKKKNNVCFEENNKIMFGKLFQIVTCPIQGAT
jgi:hypothetical protein